MVGVADRDVLMANKNSLKQLQNAIICSWFQLAKKRKLLFLLSCIVQLLSVSQHTDGYGSIHELLMTLQSSKAYYGKIVTFFLLLFIHFSNMYLQHMKNI